jgi:hypothetical protein
MEYALNGVYINVEGIPRDVMIGVEKMQTYFRPRADSYWGTGAAEVGDLAELPELPARDEEAALGHLQLGQAGLRDEQAGGHPQEGRPRFRQREVFRHDQARPLTSTLTPVLSPSEKTPVTVTYEALLLRMRNDPEVTFADTYDTAWNTSYEVEVAGGGYYMEEDSNGD